MQISKPVRALKFPSIRAITNQASTQEGSILLTIGEPDIRPPKALVDETLEYGSKHPLTYSPSGGGSKIRTLIANYYNKLSGAAFTAENVVVTIGATEAISTISRVLLQDGDEVIIPTPYFPGYPHYIEMAHGTVVFAESSEKNGFIFTPEILEKYISPKTKAILFSNPCNPTGTVMSRDEIYAIAECLKDKDIVIIADEIYASLAFDTFISFASMPQIADKLIIVSGFSKSHSMTGWRLGYMLVPQEVREYFLNAHLYNVTCPASLSIKMGELALEKFQDNSSAVKIYQERAQYFSNALKELGFKIIEPKAAFYLFAAYHPFSDENSLNFALRMLKECGVAMVPGSAFGHEGWLRVALTQEISVLQEAAARLKVFLKKE